MSATSIHSFSHCVISASETVSSRNGSKDVRSSFGWAEKRPKSSTTDIKRRYNTSAAGLSLSTRSLDRIPSRNIRVGISIFFQVQFFKHTLYHRIQWPKSSGCLHPSHLSGATRVHQSPAMPGNVPLVYPVGETLSDIDLHCFHSYAASRTADSIDSSL